MSTANSQKSSKKGKEKSGIKRRSWSVVEEQQLISALKEIVASGWKCDNGFKTGYLTVLEGLLRRRLPGTDIRAEPMITSKIHVWKKAYGSLSTMLSRSGFSWNDTMKTIDVIDDQVWDEYVKYDANARLMRHKNYPFYNDWLIIFGKDRATGESAEALVDAVNDLTKENKDQSDSSIGADNASYANGILDDNDSEHMSSLHGEGYMATIRGEGASSSQQKKGKKKIQKRAREDDLDYRIVGMMEEMTKAFAETKNSIGELAQRIGFEHDASITRKKVLDELSPLALGIEDKIKVAKVICSRPEELDIFRGLPENEQAVMVNMILQGRY